MNLRRFLAALVCLAAALRAGAEGVEPPRVAKLEIEGANAVDEDVLFESILTSKPDWRPWRTLPLFDAEDLDEDLERIASVYRDHGYYRATAASSLEWNDDRDRVRIVIRVTEGEPVRLERWLLTAPEDPDLPPDYASGLRALLPEPGSVFGVTVYKRVRTAILESMGDLGHPRASLEGGADLDTDALVATVEWSLRTGPTVRIGDIAVTGLRDVSEAVVRRELAVEAGERFSGRRLKRSQRRVFDTGLFRSVAVQPIETDAAETHGEDEAAAPGVDSTTQVVWPLEVRVVERSPRTLGVGAGYGTEDEFRARLDWTHRNFLGDAWRLSLGGRYSSLHYGGETALQQSWFLHPWIEKPLGFELRLSAVRETPRAYEVDRFREQIQLERSLGSGFTLRFGQAFEWADVTRQRIDDPDIDLPDKTRLHSLPFGLRFSHLDDPITPTLGAWLDLGVEPSFEAIGSEVDYVRIVAEARGFVPLGPTVLGVRWRMGTLEPFRDTQAEDVPVFKRFYAGGSTSVRGFGYQKLGPRDDDGDPLGGLSWAEASVELRVPIWRQLSGVLFSDAGQVNLRSSDWRARDVFYTSGAGLRLDTPVGPLRFDAARIYNPPERTDRYRFYVSVGHAF